MLKKLLILPGIVLGILAMSWLVQSKQPPAKSPQREWSRMVRVIPVPRLKVVPQARGYGYVKPGRVWEAVAEVGGKIVDRYPGLKKGVFVAEGDLLFRIEPEQSRLMMEQIRAEILSLQAQLAELDQTEQDTRRKLLVDQRNLELNRGELERRKKLLEEGVISRSQFDQEEQRLLVQQNVVETHLGTLNRLPAQRRALEASLIAQESRLEDARLTLEKTEVLAPFDARISRVEVETGQAAKVGQVLAVADSIDVAEVEAQIPRYVMRHLIPEIHKKMNLEMFLDVSQGDPERLLNLKASVKMDLQGETIRWPAQFARFAETDPRTGTLGVVVAVRDPFMKMKPGKRPPLQKNTYCEVNLYGQPWVRSVVVLRSTLHDGRVYVVNKESRLERRPVEIEFVQGNLAVIRSGLKAGEQVVVNDLVPAIDGMLLKPVEDAEALRRVVEEATRPGITP